MKTVKDLLPIGSVVLLQDVPRKVIIIGILQSRIENGKEEENFHDYLGVFFPEGYMGEGSAFVFDRDVIADVIFRGYENPERSSMMNMLEEVYRQQAGNNSPDLT